MDDFNNMNGGELNGFDSVNGKETENNGYTVTPEGGYYTKRKDDIIQDETGSGYSGGAYEQKSAEPQHGFYPNGQYSQANYGYKPPKPKKQKKGGHGAATIAVACLLAAVIGAVSGVTAVKLTSKNTDSTTLTSSSGISGSNVNINVDETAESVVEAVAQKVTPSVIGIRTTTSVRSFFGGNSSSTGEGSGVVYSSDGYIITNYHVISSAVTNKSDSKIEVFLDSVNSKSYEATVVGYNISTDLAVIKIDATGLTPISISDSDNLKVGQYVITVGNPGGLEFMDSVAYGVISGLNRVVSTDSDVKLIQTNAAINPGNSGGALVNTKGELVGITSSKIVSEEFEGMGFAIPANTVSTICKNIIDKQNDPEPYIGITVSEKYTASVLKYYGYPAGAVVLSVAEGSPADNSGIAKGDIITEFNGKEIDEYTKLEEYINECQPGKKVSAKIYRSGRYYTTDITVGSNNAAQ